jgi:hypothetical protein
MARKLRIAVSVFFGLLTVSLCVLWVRSFWRLDQWDRFNRTFAVLESNYGHLTWHYSYNEHIAFHGRASQWQYLTGPADGRVPNSFCRFEESGYAIAAPHLVLALVPAAIAIAPWSCSRFSVRDLLIAMTMLAIMMGFGVWATS